MSSQILLTNILNPQVSTQGYTVLNGSPLANNILLQFIWPNSYGDNGDVLVTDGTRNLSWVNLSSLMNNLPKIDSVEISWPDNHGNNGDVLVTDGNAKLSWVSLSNLMNRIDSIEKHLGIEKKVEPIKKGWFF
ncbi:MAG: hypothetical protein ACLPWD_04845 [Methanobacterium sp.]